MTSVVDLTQQCCTTAEPALLRDLAAIWIHRIGVSIGADAIAVARYFSSGRGARYTGGNVPYHYLGTYHQVEQLLPLDVRGAHARRWGNAWGIGFAQHGDFRAHPPSADQWRRAVDVCADLIPGLSPLPAELRDVLPQHLKWGVPVLGHGEVPATFGTNTGKDQPDGAYACPGRLWDMREFRSDVQAELRRRTAARLGELGHRLTRR